jgi:muramoyltetrapeptide carboxypeptidase
MTQLALSGVLDVVAGVMFGQCTNCVAPPPTFSIEQILIHHLGKRPYPSFAGCPNVFLVCFCCF